MLNYDFKLRDFKTTKNNHLSKLAKIKELKYNDFFDMYVEDIIASKVHNNQYYIYQTRADGRFADRTKQSVIKELKTLVNSYTREYIQERLKELDMPVSYDTAVYVKFYSKINSLMKRLLKEHWI